MGKKHKKTSHTRDPFTAGDHKPTRNRQDGIAKTNKKTNNKKIPQKKHRIGTVSKIITGGLKHYCLVINLIIIPHIEFP